MMKFTSMYKISVLFTFIWALTACSSAPTAGGASTPKGLAAVLKVTPAAGKLKAKIEFTNSRAQEVVVRGLDSRNFHVETATDSKPMPFKGKGGAAEPLHVPAGQTAEAAFNIQDNYPFWDRRTKYKIWYESPDLKTNVVQVWF